MITLLGTVTLLQMFDMSLDDGGFVETGNSGQWAYGMATSGPGSSRKVWATQLGGPYLSQAYDVLEIPLVDHSGAALPQLEFDHWYDIEGGDIAVFQVFEADAWRDVEPVYGYPAVNGFSGDSGGWIRHVVDLSGFVENAPVRVVFYSDDFGSKDGWYIGAVGLYDGDIAPPNISLETAPTDTQEWESGYLVRAQIEDNVEVVSAIVEWWLPGQSPNVVSLVSEGSGLYSAQIPGQPPDSLVSWRVSATDGNNTAVWPRLPQTEFFRVFLGPPLQPTVPAGRLVSQTIEVSWTEPITPHEVSGYYVQQVGESGPGARCPASPCEVSVDGSLEPVWRVFALYDVNGVDTAGDPSVSVVADHYVPVLSDLSPSAVAPGDQIWLRIEGNYLAFDEDVSFDAGDGLSFEWVRVMDSHWVDVLLKVHDEVVEGVRDLRVVGNVDAVFHEVLNVSSDVYKPTIVSVTPEKIAQGFQENITFCASEAFGPVVSLSLGDGLVLANQPTFDENGCLVADIAALFSAPTGVRTLLLDDGVRIWPCSLRIQETVIQTGGTCSAIGRSTGVFWWAIGCLVAFTRRRPS